MKKIIIVNSIILFLLTGCVSFSEHFDYCKTRSSLAVAYPINQNNYLEQAIDHCSEYAKLKFDPAKSYDDADKYYTSFSLWMHATLIDMLFIKKDFKRAEIEIQEYMRFMPEDPSVKYNPFVIDLEANATREKITRYYINILKSQNKTDEVRKYTELADKLKLQHESLVDTYNRNKEYKTQFKENKPFMSVEEYQSIVNESYKGEPSFAQQLEKKCMCPVSGGATQSYQEVKNVGGKSTIENVTTYSSAQMVPCFCK